MLEELAAGEGRGVFDLKKGPLVRARIVRMGEEEYAVVMTMHHIVSDAVSTAVAVRAALADTEPEMMMVAELDCAKPAVAEANSAIIRVICFFIWLCSLF